jgi:hypothetical protein
MRPYPTDKRGVPLSVAEVGIPYIESKYWNNHHLNFYARQFGATAISQSFRDLERYQEMMPKQSHVLLHQKFGGIALPAAGVMLDELYDASDKAERFKIYDTATKQYVYYDVTDSIVDSLRCIMRA